MYSYVKFELFIFKELW